MPFYVYILQSLKNNRLYIGQTRDPQDRLKRHNNGEHIATKSGIPWKIVLLEKYNSRSESVQRERYLKSLKNKKYLQKLIDAGWSSSSSRGS